MLRKKEKPSAEIFSVSYVADSSDLDRPVTFVFNGGPGASSAYLHVGAVGPQRVDFPADGTLPPMPPRLVQNDESWLAFTDLVFVDPVGTGFSRIIEKDDKKKDDEKKDGARGGKTGDEPDPKRVLRLQARPRVAVGVHRPLALEQRPLGVARASSRARATAATASAASCASSRRRRGSG